LAGMPGDEPGDVDGGGGDWEAEEAARIAKEKADAAAATPPPTRPNVDTAPGGDTPPGEGETPGDRMLREKEAQRLAALRLGRRRNIFTSPLGLQSPAVTTATLGGGLRGRKMRLGA
jgi:hypothetical protein